MHALIVDDSRTMRRVLGDILRPCGFECEEAEDGVEAIERLEECDCPQIALIDWYMPRMNGIELIGEIRKNDALAGMRIMMVSPETEMKSVIQALEAGANEYIMKPFTKEAVLEKLEILGVLAR